MTLGEEEWPVVILKLGVIPNHEVLLNQAWKRVGRQQIIIYHQGNRWIWGSNLWLGFSSRRLIHSITVTPSSIHFLFLFRAHSFPSSQFWWHVVFPQIPGIYIYILSSENTSSSVQLIDFEHSFLTRLNTDFKHSFQLLSVIGERNVWLFSQTQYSLNLWGNRRRRYDVRSCHSQLLNELH